MKKTMKRTCHDCRALVYIDNGVRCSLGYPNEKVYEKYKGSIVRPLEPCPKPYSYHDLTIAERDNKAGV